MLSTKVKKSILLISFLLIVISLIGFVSYSYYISEIFGNESESTVAITGGNIVIKYQNDSSDIVASGIYIGWSTTKQFTVSYSVNASNINVPSAVSYEMFLIVDRNDFLSGSLQYQLMPKSSDSTKTGIYSDSSYYDIQTGSNLNGIFMGKGFLVDQNVSHSYILSIKYREQADIDQYAENDAIFNARVNIKGASESSYSTLYIDLNGGEISGISLSNDNSIKVPMNKEFSLPVPTKEGDRYSFTGWEIVDGNANISGNSISINDSVVSIKASFVENPPFYYHSWDTIASNIKSGNTSEYIVGDTREIAIDGFTNSEPGSNGLYTVRIANNSTPSECATKGFSQTACGFVVEFVDIVDQRAMNSTNTNVGGWPATAMRTYLNGTFKSKLPSDLQSAIINTTVVSGHGSTSGETNFTSTDKIYLLSTKEVWGDCSESNCYDSATDVTRQLDYYANINVTKSNYSGAIKKFNGTYSWWWLRAAFYSKNDFLDVHLYGNRNFISANSTSGGVAPAFRIE